MDFSEWLDRCIAYAFERQSGELRLVSGRPPMADLGGGRFVPLTRNPVREADLARFVERLFGPESSSAGEDGHLDAIYEGGESGPLSARAVRVAGQWLVTFRPPGEAQAAAREPSHGVPPDRRAAPPGREEASAAPGQSSDRRGGVPSGEKVQVSASGAIRVDGVQNGSGVAWLEDLFRAMVRMGASDLHLSANAVPMFRIDGEMMPISNLDPVSEADVRSTLLSIAPDRNRTQFKSDGDTDFVYAMADVARFRSNLFLDRHGAGGVFRAIPGRILTFEELGLPESVLELCHIKQGLVLVTGPTGSGKSTTLAAMIDYINRHIPQHIITLEDPIEFVHPNKRCLVNQREVGVHTESFKRALRAALREDPDIVLVGEMRDLETIEIAIETAETGHLVFGTLHTRTATSTVDRLIDQFPADRQQQIRVMLSESLMGVVSQTLCRKIGGGRVAAYEILTYNRALANLIREGKTFQIASMMQIRKNDGMILLNDSLLQLVRANLIDAQEAIAKSADPTALMGALTKAGVSAERSHEASGLIKPQPASAA